VAIAVALHCSSANGSGHGNQVAPKNKKGRMGLGGAIETRKWYFARESGTVAESYLPEG